MLVLEKIAICLPERLILKEIPQCCLCACTDANAKDARNYAQQGCAKQFNEIT